MPNKIRKDAMLRARVDAGLKREMVTIAQLQGLDEADMIRIACRKLVDQYVAMLNKTKS